MSIRENHENLPEQTPVNPTQGHMSSSAEPEPTVGGGGRRIIVVPDPPPPKPPVI
jgi:hypothetical protein